MWHGGQGGAVPVLRVRQVGVHGCALRVARGGSCPVRVCRARQVGQGGAGWYGSPMRTLHIDQGIYYNRKKKERHEKRAEPCRTAEPAKTAETAKTAKTAETAETAKAAMPAML